jgi:hypothetical protein
VVLLEGASLRFDHHRYLPGRHRLHPRRLTGSTLDTLKRVADNNNDHAYCPSEGWGSKVTFNAQRGTTYRIAVGDAGSLRENTFTLKLSAPRDTQAPKVSSTSPASKATGVAPGANITATFSEAMVTNSINNTTF